MDIAEMWSLRRSALERELATESGASGMMRKARHVFSQMEQELLAGYTDDAARQRVGVLTGVFKHSLDLITLPQSVRDVSEKTVSSPAEKLLPAGAACGIAVTLLYGLYRNDRALEILCAVLLLALGILMLVSRRKTKLPENRYETCPDTAAFLRQLDSQISLLSRSLQDLDVLDRSLQTGDPARAPSLSGISGMLETVSQMDEEDRRALGADLDRLLNAIDLKAVEYSLENAGLFDLLPSKNITRTLSPALLDAREGTLLRRGTAAVMQE